MKTILITGTASGIGKETKNKFLSSGYSVIGIDKTQENSDGGFISFSCDISNEESLKKVEEYIINNNIMLDGIINIAGIHKMVSLVETEFKDLKKVIDINLLGPISVNRTFHKFLKPNGKIVIVTSEVAGFDPMPFNSIYNISKTALDCYAQALRQEINLLNQKVITIRPGSIKTPLSVGSLSSTEQLSVDTKLYKEQASKFLNLTRKFMGKVISPEKVGKLIFKVYNKKNPKVCYKINRNILLSLLNLFPKKLQCFIIKAILK